MWLSKSLATVRACGMSLYLWEFYSRNRLGFFFSLGELPVFRETGATLVILDKLGWMRECSGLMIWSCSGPVILETTRITSMVLRGLCGVGMCHVPLTPWYLSLDPVVYLFSLSFFFIMVFGPHSDVLRSHLWRCLGDQMWCQVSNIGTVMFKCLSFVVSLQPCF